MNIMLNEYCNLGCSYCFAQNVKSSKYISDEDLQTCIDFLKASDDKILKLIGGEPTIHPKFVEIVHKGLDDPFFEKVILFSNGLALTPDVIDKINSEKMGYLFNVNNPKHIGQAKYDQTVSNLRYLVSVSQPEYICLGINIFEPEFEYDYIIDLLRELKVASIRFSIVCPMTTGTGSTLEYYRQFMPQIANMLIRCKELEINACFDCPNIPMCLYEEYDIEHLLRIWFMEGYSNNCYHVIDVTPDLEVTRCFPFADKVTTKLTDFQNTEDIRQYFNTRIDDIKFDHCIEEKCKECEHRLNKKCQGGCMAFNYKGGNE